MRADDALADFLADARLFLEQHAARRQAAGNERDANDRFSLFSSSTQEEVRSAVEYQRTLFDAGYGWISGPEKLGGAGRPASWEHAFARLEREFAIPSKAPLAVSLGMVAPTVAQFAPDHVAARLLPALRRADTIGCQLFSEPAAGSDLAGVLTRATRVGDDWSLTGQKVWTTGAHYSDLGVVLARTSDGPRYRNLTVFLIDMKAAGVEVKPLRQMTGGSDFNEVFLSDARVPDEGRLGEVDGGWPVAMTMLLHERGAIGGGSTGGSGLFDLHRLAAWIEEQGRADDPAVAQAFAKVYSGVTAAKAMRARADARLRAGGVPGPEMSLGKLVLTDNLGALSNLVSLVLGPRMAVDLGQPGTFSWSEFVLGVPGMRIGGGTDEVQRNTVAERILGLPKEPKWDDRKGRDS